MCVPAANTLLHARPRKLCHFIFVPVTISHVFSGRGWIIPRRVNACGLTGGRGVPGQDRHNTHTQTHTQKTKHVSQGEEHLAFWVFFYRFADVSRSFSQRRTNDSLTVIVNRMFHCLNSAYFGILRRYQKTIHKSSTRTEDHPHVKAQTLTLTEHCRYSDCCKNISDIFCFCIC